MKILVMFSLFHLLLSFVPNHVVAQRKQPLSKDRLTTGAWEYKEKSTDINGSIFDAYGFINDKNSLHATFDIRGYDLFEVYVGFSGSSGSGSNTIIIKVDDKIAREIPISQGKRRKYVSVALTNAKGLTIMKKYRNPSNIIFANPTIIKGKR